MGAMKQKFMEELVACNICGKMQPREQMNFYENHWDQEVYECESCIDRYERESNGTVE